MTQQNQNFHISAPLVASAGTLVATGGGADSSYVQMNPTRGGGVSVLVARFTASRAVVTSSDSLQILVSEDGVKSGVPYREAFSDTDPVNLLEAFDGETDIDLAAALREVPFVALRFITSGSAITLTADEDIVIACPTR